MKLSQVLYLAKVCYPYLSPLDPERSADSLTSSDLQVRSLCRLWAGMGDLFLVSVSGTRAGAFVVKHITPPPLAKQSFGDRRKVKSYEVEVNFYQHVAVDLMENFNLQVPYPFYTNLDSQTGHVILCMSYLSSSDKQKSHSSFASPVLLAGSALTCAVLTWLATLHTAFWGLSRADHAVRQFGLHASGTYWYLSTRPEEHAAMPEHGWQGRLKLAAKAIDHWLTQDPMQCIIHGDAKEENVIVLEGEGEARGGQIAMCDFQYCGKGAPTKDLAYFFCSSVDMQDEQRYLQFYLDVLDQKLPSEVLRPSMHHLQRSLDFAYADFARFMSGWGFWGDNLQGRVEALLDQFDNGVKLKSESAYMDAVQRFMTEKQR